jgi:hypothetical protein
LAGCAAARPRPLHAHARAVREPREAGGDHALLAFSRRDHRAGIVLLADRDRPHRDLALGIDHVDEGAVRPALHRRGRHRHDLPQRLDQHADIDELPGPELQLRVGKLRLHADRAGGLIHLVVDHLQVAAIDRRLAVAATRRRAAAFREGLVHLLELLLRQVEQHRDRLTWVITTMPLASSACTSCLRRPAAAGAAVDRRGDLGVAQHRAGIVDRRLIALHLRLELRRPAPAGCRPAASIRSSPPPACCSIEIDARIGERRLVLRLLGNRLSSCA